MVASCVEFLDIPVCGTGIWHYSKQKRDGVKTSKCQLAVGLDRKYTYGMRGIRDFRRPVNKIEVPLIIRNMNPSSWTYVTGGTPQLSQQLGGSGGEEEHGAIKARIYWKLRFVVLSWKQKDHVVFANRNLVCG